MEKDKTLGEVKSQLDDLTKHIQELSVGGTMADQHGPQPDEPKLVAVEPAGDGLIRLTDGLASRSHFPMSPGLSRTCSLG